MTEETPLQGAYRSCDEARALLAAAQEALVSHFEANPDGGIDGRTRHLQAEVDLCRRRVELCEARIVALRRLEEFAAKDEAQAAQDGEEAARRQYRDRCAALLDDRRRIAAEGLIEWLAVELGSRTVPRGFAGNAQGWIGHLCRTTSLDIASEALGLVQARKTEA